VIGDAAETSILVTSEEASVNISRVQGDIPGIMNGPGMIKNSSVFRSG
jgi:hypothetical protein